MQAITEIARAHEEQVHRRARTLAECEAKRRIVEDCVHLETASTGALLAHARWACRALTLPYASHPDYREEWRP